EDDIPSMKNPGAAAGLPQLKPEGGRKNLNLRGDTKAVYEQLGAAFGVKIAFDPDLAAKNVRLVVDDVDFFTAVSLLATQSKTFWRALDASMIFVAPDTPDKRRQYDVELEQTFPLRSGATPE